MQKITKSSDQRVSTLFLTFGDPSGTRMTKERADLRHKSGDYIVNTLNVLSTNKEVLSKAIAESDEVVFSNHADPVTFPLGEGSIQNKNDLYYYRPEEVAGFIDQLITDHDKEKIKKKETKTDFIFEGCNTGTCYEAEKKDTSLGKHVIVQDAVHGNNLKDNGSKSSVMSKKEARKAKKRQKQQTINKEATKEETSTPVSSLPDSMYKTNSFAGRLASSLAERGITNINVIGYRGQVGPKYSYSAMPDDNGLVVGGEKVPLQDAQLKLSVDNKANVSVLKTPSGPKSRLEELDVLILSGNIGNELHSSEINEKRLFPVPGLKKYAPLDKEYLAAEVRRSESKSNAPKTSLWSEKISKTKQNSSLNISQ